MARGQHFGRFCEKIKENFKIIDEVIEEEFEKEVDYYDKQIFKHSKDNTKQQSQNNIPESKK